jgi:hypothetical protein
MHSGTVDELKGRCRRAPRRQEGQGGRPRRSIGRETDRETAIFGSVHVLRDTGTEFLCLVGYKQVWVPLTEIRYGTDLTKTGDCGRLLTSTWFARNLGLC